MNETIRIGQLDVTQAELEQLVDLIRRPIGTPVRITTPKELYAAVDRRIMTPEEARAWLGLPPPPTPPLPWWRRLVGHKTAPAPATTNHNRLGSKASTTSTTSRAVAR